MTKLFVVLTLFSLVACGKGGLFKNNSGTSTANSALSMETTLTVPAQGVAGGSPALIISGQSHPVNYAGSSPQAQQYISALMYNQIPVQPLYQNYGSKTYRVRVDGANVVAGQCPFNPTAQCNVVNINNITAY